MTTDIGRITVPANVVAREITATVTVSGMRRFNVRCAIGMWLLALAAWVLPFETKVEVQS